MNEQIIWNDKIDVNYYISTQDEVMRWDGVIRWDGKMWDYLGIRYRSLRELKSMPSYKLLNLFADELADEIWREVCKDIVSKITETTSLQ